MNGNKPEPVCKAFLVCRQVATEPQSGEAVLVGLPMDYSQRRFPAAAMVGFFARLTDARGSYEVEIQLRNADGDVVWADVTALAAQAGLWFWKMLRRTQCLMCADEYMA
ncbi:MAG TPA: hypothetical protein VGZ47_12775 [Gemmataceae bacterium]|jgi:hypothetical protein|nr:hypothetical protein [Gemmataceae bacterium]